jgi:hypothetical protein
MQRLCSNPRVGASRPVPNGTLTLLLRQGAARQWRCLSASLRDAWDASRRRLCPADARAVTGAGTTRASDGFRGAPTTRQRWWGRERSDRKPSAAPTTEAKRGASFPYALCYSFRRIWSSSGRSTGFLLVGQRKVAPTASFLPDPFCFLLVGGRLGVALVSAG